MENSKRGISTQNAEQILKRWIDKNFEINENALIETQWTVMPVVDTLNAMEAEWLTEAIKKLGIFNIMGINFEYNMRPSVDSVKLNQDAILEFIFQNSFKYILLTSVNADFIYYKDQENRYFLLCGPSSFTREAYKCSYETAKLMYFDYWVNDGILSEEEKIFLTRIWEKYSKFASTLSHKF